MHPVPIPPEIVERAVARRPGAVPMGSRPADVRDAIMPDLRGVMAADCGAANSDAGHDASLAALRNILGDVMTGGHATERPRAGAAARRAA